MKEVGLVGRLCESGDSDGGTVVDLAEMGD